jgi:hypothetical protein
MGRGRTVRWKNKRKGKGIWDKGEQETEKERNGRRAVGELF